MPVMFVMERHEAIAVAECVPSLVESPVDGKPLQVRIGIHTGHCMGGVVGTLTPHCKSPYVGWKCVLVKRRSEMIPYL